MNHVSFPKADAIASAITFGWADNKLLDPKRGVNEMFKCSSTNLFIYINTRVFISWKRKEKKKEEKTLLSLCSYVCVICILCK